MEFSPLINAPLIKGDVINGDVFKNHDNALEGPMIHQLFLMS